MFQVQIINYHYPWSLVVGSQAHGIWSTKVHTYGSTGTCRSQMRRLGIERSRQRAILKQWTIGIYNLFSPWTDKSLLELSNTQTLRRSHQPMPGSSVARSIEDSKQSLISCHLMLNQVNTLNIALFWSSTMALYILWRKWLEFTA